jgi:hypothetical protein
MNEADVKREIVRILLREGCFARRIEDKYAIGTLDMLIITPMHTIYAEAKHMRTTATMVASTAQADQIHRFNRVGNPSAYALMIGYKDKQLGFSLPGQRWDQYRTCPWPPAKLTDEFDLGVLAIFGDAHE